MTSHHHPIAASTAAGLSPGRLVRLAARQLRPLTGVLCCMLVGAGCSLARQNDPVAAPAQAPTIVEGPPAVPPPRHSSARESDRVAWARHSKLGREYLAARRYREAEDEFVLALRQSGAYGPSAQRQATSLANLERVAARYGSSPADEIRITRVILPVAIALRGRSDSSVARHSEVLGRALVATGQFEAARAPLGRALAIYRERSGDDSLDVARVHAQLAKLEQGAGNLAAAEVEIQRALEIEQRVVGSNSPTLATPLGSYAGLLNASGRTADAEATLLQAADLAAAAGGLTEAIALNDLAWFYTQNDRAVEAEPLAQRALELLVEQSASTNQVAAVLDTLGASLLEQGKYEKAEVHLARAYGLAGGKFAPPFDGIQQHYARLLRETGREREAAAIDAGVSPTALEDATGGGPVLGAAEATETTTDPIPAEATEATTSPTPAIEPGASDTGEIATIEEENAS